jgi:hypothetical protein
MLLLGVGYGPNARMNNNTLLFENVAIVIRMMKHNFISSTLTPATLFRHTKVQISLSLHL